MCDSEIMGTSEIARTFEITGTGARVAATPEQTECALIHAIINRDHDKIQKLVEKGAPMTERVVWRTLGRIVGWRDSDPFRDLIFLLESGAPWDPDWWAQAVMENYWGFTADDIYYNHCCSSCDAEDHEACMDKIYSEKKADIILPEELKRFPLRH